MPARWLSCSLWYLETHSHLATYVKLHRSGKGMLRSTTKQPWRACDKPKQQEAYKKHSGKSKWPKNQSYQKLVSRATKMLLSCLQRSSSAGCQSEAEEHVPMSVLYKTRSLKEKVTKVVHVSNDQFPMIGHAYRDQYIDLKIVLQTDPHRSDFPSPPHSQNGSHTVRCQDSGCNLQWTSSNVNLSNAHFHGAAAVQEVSPCAVTTSREKCNKMQIKSRHEIDVSDLYWATAPCCC